jgi:hypothetical protein
VPLLLHSLLSFVLVLLFTAGLRKLFRPFARRLKTVTRMIGSLLTVRMDQGIALTGRRNLIYRERREKKNRLGLDILVIVFLYLSLPFIQFLL